VEVIPCSVHELSELLASATTDASLLEDYQLIDVREPWEADIASLPGFQLLPLSRFEEWGPNLSQQLDPSKETVVLCHHGVRSMQAASYFTQHGFKRVKNVSGGIDAYSRGVDPSVPQY